jgi:hypothetical protein
LGADGTDKGSGQEHVFRFPDPRLRAGPLDFDDADGAGK